MLALCRTASQGACTREQGAKTGRSVTALRHISANLAPSEKQVRYLDYLAQRLGYRHGGEFIATVVPSFNEAPALAFNRALVHNAIDWAKARLKLSTGSQTGPMTQADPTRGVDERS